MPNTKPSGVAYSDPDFDSLSLAGTAVTSTAAELNILHGATATAAELNTLHGSTATVAEISSLHDEIASVTTTATPATGTNGVQFVFKNAAGATVASVRSMVMYLSSSVGLPVAAATSVAALTNGYVDTLIVGKVAQATTSAAGLLGVTLTANAAAYYLSFVLPNGKVITSSILTVN